MASVRLPDVIDMQLGQLCKLTRRSKSFYIKEALARYLEDISDDYIALERTIQPGRTLLSTAEVLQALDK